MLPEGRFISCSADWLPLGEVHRRLKSVGLTRVCTVSRVAQREQRGGKGEGRELCALESGIRT